MKSFTDSIIETVTGLILVSLIVGVVIFLVALAVAGFFLFLYLKHKFDQATKIEYARPRLFGASPQIQWTSTYEYLLYKLEDITGLTFTQWPGQILIGCLIISIGGALTLGILFTVVMPSSGTTWLTLFGLGGAGLGVLTGTKLGNPFGNLYSLNNGSGSASSGDENSQGSLGTLLGIEDE
ncbi:MAG: hypothetical protein ABI690_29650 [Chloroflexota bacterium]